MKLFRIPTAFLASICFLLVFFSVGCSESNFDQHASSNQSPPPLWGDYPNARPSCIKGIHLTSWVAGSRKERARFEKLLADTELNTVVIDIKESQGEVYIPGILLDYRIDVSVPAIRDLSLYLAYLKERGVYTIGRLVVFKDTRLAKEKPEWAVRSSTPLFKAIENGYPPEIWVDDKGSAWADPYNSEVWSYNLDVAEKAIDLGFQEIQFDYIRFPSDGPTINCLYSKSHSPEAAAQALASFLRRAHERLKPKEGALSIDVFGLAGSYNDGLGIGQKLSALLESIDAVSPMMYPSHYAKGEFGLADPNRSPYETVYRSVKDTLRVIGERKIQLRPFLQDFSLGVKYGANEVRAQIQAANDHGIGEWLLWNPGCRYTAEALQPQ